MSVRVLTQVFGQSKATLGSRLVLLALADAAHDDGVTWIDQKLIASKARVSKATVVRTLQELEKAGEVETRKAQRGRRRINVYRVLVPGLLPVDYDQLPFALKEPFSDDVSDCDVVDDDVANGGPTRSHPEAPRARQDSEPKGNRKGANAPNARDEPPAGVLVEGRNLPLDTLCEECGVMPSSPRLPQAIVALNGRVTPETHKVTDPGIRHLFWAELVRWADEHDPDRPAALHDDPERFAQALARGIQRKAAIYRERMPRATCSPTALRNWWLDLELLPEPGRDGGISPADIDRITDG